MHVVVYLRCCSATRRKSVRHHSLCTLLYRHWLVHYTHISVGTVAHVMRRDDVMHIPLDVMACEVLLRRCSTFLFCCRDWWCKETGAAA